MDADIIDKIILNHSLPNPIKKADIMGYVIKREDWADHIRTPKPYPCCIHIDLALTRDQCGFALSHWNPVNNRCSQPIVHQIKCTPRMPLNFQAVRNMVIQLKELGWMIVLVSYDNFQSAESMQQLELQGIPTEKVSVDSNTAPYDTLADYISDDAYEFYPHPVAVRELKKLIMVAGKKIDHPKKKSKDVADAQAGSAFITARDLRIMTGIGKDPGSQAGFAPPSAEAGGGGRDGVDY